MIGDLYTNGKRIFAELTPIHLGWYKLKPQAIIPTKCSENAGFDIYTIEENVTLEPHSQHLFSTGLAAVVEEGWWLRAEDRGSTGSKGLHIHCGVVDNGYRGEIFICLNNDNPYPVKFTNAEEPGIHKHQETQMITRKNSDGLVLAVYETKLVDVIDYLVYPTSKAIAQLVLIPQPDVYSRELTVEEWEAEKITERGEGKLGSSGK